MNAPELDPAWPTSDPDTGPPMMQEAEILHELVRELGIPEIVLIENGVELVGTHIPGGISFDRTLNGGWGWAELWTEFDRPLAGLPTPHKRAKEATE